MRNISSERIQNLCLLYTSVVLRFLGKVLALFTPFLIGGAIAFLINVVLRPLECCWNKVCRRAPEKLARPVCLTASTVLVLGILFAVVFMMIPSLRESGEEFVQNIPLYVEEIGRWWAGIVRFAAKYNIVPVSYTHLVPTADAASYRQKDSGRFSYTLIKTPPPKNSARYIVRMVAAVLTAPQSTLRPKNWALSR